MEIIVVDNGSNEAVINNIENNIKDVTLIKLKNNYGHAIGVNIGIKNSKYDYYAIIDNDAKIDAKWSQNALKIMREKSHVGVCGSLMVDEELNMITSYGGDLTFFGATRNLQYQTKVEGLHSNYVPFVSAGAMLVRKKILEDIEYLFDDSFFIGYNDLDLCLRAWISGWYVLVSSELFSNHPVQNGSWSNLRLFYGIKNYLTTLTLCLPQRGFVFLASQISRLVLMSLLYLIMGNITISKSIMLGFIYYIKDINNIIIKRSRIKSNSHRKFYDISLSTTLRGFIKFYRNRRKRKYVNNLIM